MKFLALSVVVLYCSLCVFSDNSLTAELSEMDQWKEYKQTHNKTYQEAEDASRFANFQETLKKINEHNAKYERKETSYKMGLNAMSDWTDEERQNLHGVKLPKD